MARIRTVKPEFFRHETLQDLEIEHPELRAMLVFEALWGHCDKNGTFEWKPRQLQLDILPFIWEATGKQLGSTLEALVNNGFILTYSDGLKTYGYIPTFKEHQRINGKEAQSPALYPEIEQMQEVIISEATGKQWGSNREASETTGREGKGIGREEEKEGKRMQGETSLVVPLKRSRPTSKKSLSDEEWLQSLKSNQAYGHINIPVEFGKMAAWCEVKKKQPTRSRFLNWLNRIEKPISGISVQRQGPKTFNQIIEENNRQAAIEFAGGLHEGSGQADVCSFDERSRGGIQNGHQQGDNGRLFPVPV